MKFHTKKPLRDTRNHLDKYTGTCLQSQTFLLPFSVTTKLSIVNSFLDAKILPEVLKSYVKKSNAIYHRSDT